MTKYSSILMILSNEYYFSFLSGWFSFLLFSSSCRMTEYFTNIMLLFYLMKIFDIDVKPANVLLDSSGTVKLCDFGLTQLRQQNSKDKEDVLIQGGTLPYMSPELLQLSVYSDSIPPEARTIDAAATSELDLAKSDT